jgi:NitT/TauT family transport system permease protein
MSKIINLPNLLFVFTVISIFLPGKREVSPPYVFLAVVLILFIIFQIKFKDKNNRNATKDVASVCFSLLLIWEIATTKLNIANQVLIPTPEEVFMVFITTWKLMWTGFLSSMALLFSGFLLALTLGISGGLFVGWNPRLRKVVFPISKAISTVPALVYTPYVVAIMPTFTAASIFVVFSGIFWSTFMNQINYVGSIDKRIVDSAKALNVKTIPMLFKVILPFTLPRNIDLLAVSLSVSFMTLTAAEMIGANSGMGYFVRKFCDYADYPKVIAGIIFIGLVVTFLNILIDKIKKNLVKWNY